MADNAADAVAQALGKPFGLELPENALKIRRNLLAAAALGIGMVLTGAEVRNPSISGITLTEVTSSSIRTGLVLFLAYFWCHFLWYVVEAYTEWRLRLTGTRLAHQTGAIAASVHGDYPSDPRQSTLYSWWKEQARRIGDLAAPMDEIEQNVKFWHDRMTALSDQQGDGLNYANAVASITRVETALREHKRQLETVQEVLTAARIPVSLERFDGWFYWANRVSNLRWLFIETTFPLALGVASIITLLIAR